MFVFFNLTFAPLFAAGLLGMPRRVSTYAPSLHGINVFVSISAFLLGLSMLVFLVNLVYSMVVARVPAAANPWRSRGARVPAADARAGHELRAHAGDPGRSVRVRRARRRAGRGPRTGFGGAVT